MTVYFLAVADAHKAKQEAADVTDIDESEEYNEKEDNSDVPGRTEYDFRRKKT